MRRLGRSIACCAMLAVFAVPTARAAAAPTVDFDTQIIPVFTKAGCNTGACHGAAIGRGGFKLSLYGGDPAADFRAVVQELEGRRVNLAKPALSLLLQKPTEELNHGGGGRLELDGPGHQRLLAWIVQGARRTTQRKLTSFTLSPATRIVSRLGTRIPLTAIATFSDGKTVDVTRWTVFTPEDIASVSIDQSTAVVRRQGEHTVIARFLDRVLPMRFTMPHSKTAIDHSAEPRRNFVDALVLKKLSTLRFPVSPSVNDSAFLRRLTLDLTGRLPTPKEHEKFLARSREQRRGKLIDRLLKSPAFTEYWTFQYAKLLRIRSQPQDTQGAITFHNWLKQRIEKGTPFDEIARTLITAQGDSHTNGPANFYRTVTGPRAQAEFISEMFLGARLRCANCHNHPLDSWTQDDYHGFAAIFARIQSGRIVKVGTRGEVTHPRTGEAATPRIPGVRFLTTKSERADGRLAFANWLTDRENPFFARAVVNRLWKQLMGRGLVEPVDDFRSTNPATHPELLRKLATDFVTHGYDLRHTIRRIVESATYERSSAPVAAMAGRAGNAKDDRFYSRGLVSRLEAEVLADAISDVTGIPGKYGSQPLGTRAVALFDPKIPSTTLDILGRCDRSGSCDAVSASGGGLAQQLNMINGPLINRNLSSTNGRLHKLLKAGKSNRVIVDEFFMRALARKPTKSEWARFQGPLRKAKTSTGRREILEDIVWSVLVCQEFTTRR